MSNKPSEPGVVKDFDIGIPGLVDTLPEDDANQDEPTAINNEEEDI